jgi:hypothetical protein
MLFDQIADPEQDVGALAQRGGAPGRIGRLGLGDGGCQFVGRREVHVLRELPGRRIEDRTFAAGRARDGGAADPVTDATRAGGRR